MPAAEAASLGLLRVRSWVLHRQFYDRMYWPIASLSTAAAASPRSCLQVFLPEALSKGKLQDNNEFMQWFYGYWQQ